MHASFLMGPWSASRLEFMAFAVAVPEAKSVVTLAWPLCGCSARLRAELRLC
jgi:hypothetical protein